MCQKSSCGCSSQSKDKCVPKIYTNNIVYNGGTFDSSSLSSIKPNCGTLSALLETFGAVIGSFVGGHTIQDEGVSLTERSKLNFVGADVTVTDDVGSETTVVTISPNTDSGHVIENEGSALPAQPAMNFIGTQVNAVDNPGQNRTDITILEPFTSSLVTLPLIDSDIVIDTSFTSANITKNSGSATYQYKILENKSIQFKLTVSLDMTVSAGAEDFIIGLTVENLPTLFSIGSYEAKWYSDSVNLKIPFTPLEVALGGTSISLRRLAHSPAAANYPGAKIIVTGTGVTT